MHRRRDLHPEILTLCPQSQSIDPLHPYNIDSLKQPAPMNRARICPKSIPEDVVGNGGIACQKMTTMTQWLHERPWDNPPRALHGYDRLRAVWLKQISSFAHQERRREGDKTRRQRVTYPESYITKCTTYTKISPSIQRILTPPRAPQPGSATARSQTRGASTYTPNSRPQP